MTTTTTIPTTGAPTTIGDVIQFTLTFTPPLSDPTGVVSAAHLLVERPDGTLMTSQNGAVVSTNVWKFTAPEQCQTAGQYIVRVNATAGMVRSIEFGVNISKSKFTSPLA